MYPGQSLNNLKKMTKFFSFLSYIPKSKQVCFIGYNYSFMFVKEDKSCFPYKEGVCVY